MGEGVTACQAAATRGIRDHMAGCNPNLFWIFLDFSAFFVKHFRRTGVYICACNANSPLERIMVITIDSYQAAFVRTSTGFNVIVQTAQRTVEASGICSLRQLRGWWNREFRPAAAALRAAWESLDV